MAGGEGRVLRGLRGREDGEEEKDQAWTPLEPRPRGPLQKQGVGPRFGSGQDEPRVLIKQLLNMGGSVGPLDRTHKHLSPCQEPMRDVLN